MDPAEQELVNDVMSGPMPKNRRSNPMANSNSQPAPGRSFGDIGAMLDAANKQVITPGDLVSVSGIIRSVRPPRTMDSRSGGKFTTQNIRLDDGTGTFWYVMHGDGPWLEEDKIDWHCEVKGGKWKPWSSGQASVAGGQMILTTGKNQPETRAGQTRLGSGPPFEHAFCGVAVIAVAIANEYELGADALDTIMDQVISFSIGMRDSPVPWLNIETVLKIGKVAWQSQIRDRIFKMLPEEEPPQPEQETSEPEPQPLLEEAAEPPPPQEEQEKNDFPF